MMKRHYIAWFGLSVVLFCLPKVSSFGQETNSFIAYTGVSEECRNRNRECENPTNLMLLNPDTLEARAGVFGAGDVTGLGGFTHLTYYHGQVIARRLRGMDARADHTAVPRVTFTDPEVASVGLSEAAARARGIDVIVASADPAETARGYIHDFHKGTLKLVGDRTRGVLIGATMVTPRAGEIVGELVLAIKLGTPLTTLADVIHPFPAFNRMLGASLNELAAKVVGKGEHHEQSARPH